MSVSWRVEVSFGIVTRRLSPILSPSGRSSRLAPRRQASIEYVLYNEVARLCLSLAVKAGKMEDGELIRS